ncbi:hypothetical protein D3C73_834720 [compost metagenome]
MFTFGTAKVREPDVGHFVMYAQQAELQLDFLPVFTGALFQVPFALLAPAEANRPLRCHQLTVALIYGDGFPLWVVFLPQAIHQIGGSQQATGGVIACFARLEHHQHRHIGVATHVVTEVAHLTIQVELFEHHVAHCQRHGAVGALLRIEPLVAQFGDFGIVRRHRHGFGAFVAHFGEEVGVRGTRLRHVRAPGDDVGGVVPVGRFRHVGLFAPGHWRGRG